MNDLPSNATLADVTKTVKAACDIIARIRSQNLAPRTPQAQVLMTRFSTPQAAGVFEHVEFRALDVDLG